MDIGTRKWTPPQVHEGHAQSTQYSHPLQHSQLFHICSSLPKSGESFWTMKSSCYLGDPDPEGNQRQALGHERWLFQKQGGQSNFPKSSITGHATIEWGTIDRVRSSVQPFSTPWCPASSTYTFQRSTRSKWTTVQLSPLVTITKKCPALSGTCIWWML